MELIIKTYGKVLLESVVLALFLLLLMSGVRDEEGNIGVFHLMGASLKEEQSASGSNFVNYVEESRRGVPQIFCKKGEMLHLGSYDVAELVGAVDCEGRELPLQIRSVCNPQGIPETDVYHADTAQISFDRPGIYILEIGVTDAWNHRSVCRIRIPVNR